MIRRIARNDVMLGLLATTVSVVVALAASAAERREVAGVASEAGGFTELVLQLVPATRDVPNSADRSIAVLRRRLDLFGVRNAQVIREGRDRIAVEALGDPIPGRLPAVLTTVGRLTFQLVDDEVSSHDLAAGRLPPGDVLRRGVEPSCGWDCRFALKRKAWITGDMIERANQGFGDGGDPNVDFRLDERGEHLFAEVTNDNVGKRFAIVFDGRVIAAPTIITPILGGEGEISGNFTVESASDMALLLQSGALPAPLVVVATRSAPR